MTCRSFGSIPYVANADHAERGRLIDRRFSPPTLAILEPTQFRVYPFLSPVSPD